MKPSVFLFEERPSAFHLFVGQISPAECLRELDGMTKISVIEFGATSYKRYGWATERTLPPMDTANDLISLFDNEGDIGLICLEVEIDGVGILMLDDDRGCTFDFLEKKTCLDFIQKLTPGQNHNLLINKLLSHQGTYFGLDDQGDVIEYAQLEDHTKIGA